jgi:uncharacterized protein YybS (DUF2232 family)
MQVAKCYTLKNLLFVSNLILSIPGISVISQYLYKARMKGTPGILGISSKTFSVLTRPG